MKTVVSRLLFREGGQYGAVGKIFTFERNGVAETAWGRHGEIERVYIFEAGNDAITARKDGWFGTVDRTLVFEGIDASVFREPEAFLQFLIFTERRAGEIESADTDRAADVASRDGFKVSRYAFYGKRHSSSDAPTDSEGSHPDRCHPRGGSLFGGVSRRRSRPEKKQ